jgi:hypothetical protein
MDKDRRRIDSQSATSQNRIRADEICTISVGGLLLPKVLKNIINHLFLA